MNAVAERKPVANDVNVYEFTLAEFPIAIFSSAPQTIKDQDYFQYQDTIKGRGGKPVERVWTLYKDPINGFPNESTLSTFYEIIQIWKEQGFASAQINFGSFANLIQRKGLKGRPGKKDYMRIQRDLDRLRGVRIKAQNAFWDSQRHQYVDKDFNLFNEITSYKDNPNSKQKETILEASTTLYKSVVGDNNLFVTDIPSEEFHKLPHLAQRMAIYLAKVFKFQSVHKRSVLEFAQQLPIHGKLYKHKKQTLRRTCDAIRKAPIGLLEAYDFEEITKRPKNEYIVLFSARKKLGAGLKGKPHSQFPKDDYLIDALVKEILAVCQDRHSTGFYRKVAYYMPIEDIRQALSEIKDLKLSTKEVNTGAFFTNRIKSFAEQRGIYVLSKKK